MTPCCPFQGSLSTELNDIDMVVVSAFMHASLLLARRSVSISSNSPISAVESIWLEVHSPLVPSKILVGCIYRPPSPGLNSVQFLLDMVNHALNLRDHVVDCGDLNVNFLGPNHPQSILLSDFINTRNLLDPLGLPAIAPPSLISSLFHPKELSGLHVVDIGISDHSAISLGLCWSKPKPR